MHECENLEVPVLEVPGKWLPQPRPKPCETQKKVKKKTNNRGSKRRKHWSYGEQAPSTRCFCHPPHIAVIVYGFGILGGPCHSVTLPILLSWFMVCKSDASQCIAVRSPSQSCSHVYGFGILNQVEWFNFMLWHPT